MKRFIFQFASFSLLFSTTILPYTATKKGIVVEAVDCMRNPNSLCVQAPLSEHVQAWIGTGLHPEEFLNAGMRPVKVTITNNSNQPVMLAPYYGLKIINSADAIKRMTSAKALSNRIGLGIGTGVATYFALTFLGLAAVAPHDNEAFLVGGSIIGAGALGLWGSVVFLSYLESQFNKAMAEKFEELNFKDETLILPGQKIEKLLLAQKDAYISRFPIVIYPLENREDMIVFDVDLRT